MKPNKYQTNRFLAYDAANVEYETFPTKEKAEEWLNECIEEGISAEAMDGYNYIAEIKWRSVYEETDNKSNYHEHTEECEEDCDDEEWPYNSDFDSVGVINYEEVEY